MRSAYRFLLLILLPILACNPLGASLEETTAAVAPSPSSTQAPHAEGEATLEPPAYIPPQCENIPVATLPAATAITEATPLPAGQINPPLSAEEQLGVLEGLVNAVLDHYIYPEAPGEAWLAQVAETRSRIEGGLETDAFYAEIQPLISALDDEHSHFQTPAQVAEDAAASSGTYSFVGIGALFQPLEDTARATVVAVFEGGPAWYAGIRQHDTLLAVDGGPIRDPRGVSRTRGPECSAVVLTIQTPGQLPRDLTVIRSSVSAPLPVYPGLVPTSDGSRVGYIFIPTMRDEVIPETVRQALEGLGPLDALVLDNRMNGGGLGSVAEEILGFFTSGYVGDFVSRSEVDPWEIEAHPVHNSQDVPLIVLVAEDTVSYGEVVSGVLRDIGRARVVGQTTSGNVEQLRLYDFDDGSRAWLASARFEPLNADADWEAEGIVPDVEVIAGWDTFTFETDPAIAAALVLLGRE